MKKNLAFIVIVTSFILFIGIMTNRTSQVQESITYFPIDPKVTFNTAHTSLNNLKSSKKSDKYMLDWNLESTLDRTAYLRQDIGLLFSNGRLIAKQGKWKQNTASLQQKRQVVASGSANFQAITFHHAEIHENHTNIFSSQKISGDQIYVIQLQNGPYHSFRNDFSKEEQEWKLKLDQQTKEFLHHSWEKGIRSFSINPERYYSFPLTDLFFKQISNFPGFTDQETNQIIGNLWEGIYKNYFLGIKKADGTKINPIGSTIPLILIAKDKSHLLVLTETSKGEPTLLRQMIEYEH